MLCIRKTVAIWVAASPLLLCAATKGETAPIQQHIREINPTRQLDRALLEAVLRNHTAAVVAALRAGAHPNAREENYSYAGLGTMAYTGLGLLEPLLDRLGPTALLMALERPVSVPQFGWPNRHLVRILLRHGADPNIHSAIGDTPLIRAVAWGHIRTVRLLLDYRADVNEAIDQNLLRQNNAGSPYAFSTGLRAGSLAVRNPDLIIGWDTNRPDYFGPPPPFGRYMETPLMVAVVEGRSDIARLLLARGARVDARDSQGWTALMYAVAGIARSSSDVDCVQMLLHAGADIHAVAQDGTTAYKLATLSDVAVRDRIVQLLKQVRGGHA